MPSSDGSPEQPAESYVVRITGGSAGMRDRLRADLREILAGQKRAAAFSAGLTDEERDRIADGEPYCFRCGKPASSFKAYDYLVDDLKYVKNWNSPTRADAVREEEGTYNPATNRFACDACYIAIGMPAGPNGWQAP